MRDDKALANDKLVVGYLHAIAALVAAIVNTDYLGDYDLNPGDYGVTLELPCDDNDQAFVVNIHKKPDSLYP